MSSGDRRRDVARTLIRVKDAIEADINLQLSILRANSCDMTTPLVDPEGFPRADLDIYAIRSARTRIIELRNDLKHCMDEIEKALQEVYDPSLAPPPSPPADTPSTPSTDAAESLSPFAKVDGVAPGSPAAHAVCPFLCSLFQIASLMYLIGASSRRPHHKVWSSDDRLVLNLLSGTFG